MFLDLFSLVEAGYSAVPNATSYTSNPPTAIQTPPYVARPIPNPYAPNPNMQNPAIINMEALKSQLSQAVGKVAGKEIAPSQLLTELQKLPKDGGDKRVSALVNGLTYNDTPVANIETYLNEILYDNPRKTILSTLVSKLNSATGLAKAKGNYVEVLNNFINALSYYEQQRTEISLLPLGKGQL